MSYEQNPYYNPKACNLVLVDELNEPLDYAFNILAVWQHPESKRVFYAKDSGCSCPIPFEMYHFNSPDETNLDEITKINCYGFSTSVEQFPATMEERQNILKKVRNVLAESSDDIGV